MNTLAERPDQPAPLRRRVFGSFLSALVGLSVLVVSYYICAVAANKSADIGTLIFVAVFGGAFVFATWLVLLLPLYLFVPRTSLFWRWPLCTVCGALAGAAIVCASYGQHRPDFPTLMLLGTVTGAATCLFGSLTARFFRDDRIASSGAGIEEY